MTPPTAAAGAGAGNHAGTGDPSRRGDPARTGDPDGLSGAFDDALALQAPAPAPVPAAPGPPRPGPAAAPAPAPHDRHSATPWPDARETARKAAAAARPAPEPVPLGAALGRLLGGPLAALTDLPSFDTSAMDGWAVAGPGPWRIDEDGAVLAGHAPAGAVDDGTAVRIATGARIPSGATAVIRSEHARTDAGGRLHADREVVPGQDIRPRGQECRTGDPLLPSGALVTPAVLGLAAAAGYDELFVLPRPTVEVLVLGDELLTSGLPHEGLIRDALGPLLGPWLQALGADVLGTRRIGDDADALYGAVTGSAADLVITTGGTAAGPVDHVHPVLAKAGAELLVDGVKVRPGHPMLLARLADGRHLVGLPGNPLAAVSGLLTLAEPLLLARSGRPAAEPYRGPVRDEVQGHPHDTRLVPVVHHGDHLVPLHYNGPAMLRGIAAADGMAVVPPGGARAGDTLDVLDLPWSAPMALSPEAGTAAAGGCFT
ncbi:molybdopterin molybdotransferase MoeA [Streptomyces sp. NPDC048604]|uniref:molybdopterin molybdotransferase MoeA n=1 Tax=Streptomyces sp. NPDC048604 TaxID=3365578 RepID=UPI003721195A